MLTTEIDLLIYTVYTHTTHTYSMNNLYIKRKFFQFFSPQILPTSSSSQMITFTFSNGGVATMRTSGTEPKIKYYTELCAAPGNR